MYLTAWLGCASLCDGIRIFWKCRQSPPSVFSGPLPLQLGRSFSIHYLEENNVMRKGGAFFSLLSSLSPFVRRNHWLTNVKG